MRKVLYRLLSLVMVFLLTGGSVQAMQVHAAAVRGIAGAADIAAESLSGGSDRKKESKGPAGVWKLTEMKGDDNEKTMSKEDLQHYESLGVVMYMELHDDRTVMFSLFGEEMNGTWDDNWIVLEYEWLTYSLKDDVLKVKYPDGGKMVFKRSSKKEIYGILGYKEGVLDEDVHYSQKDKKILDTDEASVVVTGYKADMTGFTVYLRCKNKTRREIMISETSCALNKYIFNPDWSVSLDRRETVESEMKFRPVDLEKSGISVIDEILLELKLTNSTNMSTIRKGIRASLYPTKKKAEDIRVAKRTPVRNEMVILKNAKCAFIIQGIDTDEDAGCTVNCYLENRTDHKLTFTWTGAAVNDRAASAVYEEEVLPGTLGYSKVVFPKSTLDDNGIDITKISKIKAVIKVKDNSKTTPEVIIEKEFTYTP